MTTGLISNEDHGYPHQAIVKLATRTKRNSFIIGADSPEEIQAEVSKLAAEFSNIKFLVTYQSKEFQTVKLESYNS